MLGMAIDLAMGHPAELAMRASLLALGVAERWGLGRPACVDAHLVTLLRFVGCTAHAAEVSAAFGDEIALRARFALLDPGNPAQMLPAVVRNAGAHEPIPRRLVTAAKLVAGGAQFTQVNFRTSCETARLLAERLGLGDGVRSGLWHAFERWDGRGVPNRVRGDGVDRSARVALVVYDLLVLQAAYGHQAAVALIAERAGGAYDPELATLVVDHADELVRSAYDGSAWDRVVDAAPDRDEVLTGPGIDDALTVLADFTDLKVPELVGHSRRVAELATAAMTALGGADEASRAHRAGLVHDLGRTAVPNSIWSKPGPLSDAEWERVRLHPYQTERLLARVPALATVATVAGAHHERADGSGYFRGSQRTDLTLAGCVLAAADAYASMTAARPYRPALGRDPAARTLRAEAAAGRLDPRAVEAVLGADGHDGRPAPPWPYGLTAREVDVLRLVARGLTNREVARELVVSERTVAHHVEHIFTKTGVSTRGATALFAVHNGLLPDR